MKKEDLEGVNLHLCLVFSCSMVYKFMFQAVLFLFQQNVNIFISTFMMMDIMILIMRLIMILIMRLIMILIMRLIMILIMRLIMRLIMD